MPLRQRGDACAQLASKEQIKRAYRLQSLRYHHDKVQPEDAERGWLDTMGRPPLIGRQKAMAAPFAIP